jgi:hypothetical protein
MVGQSFKLFEVIVHDTTQLKQHWRRTHEIPRGSGL